MTINFCIKPLSSSSIPRHLSTLTQLVNWVTRGRTHGTHHTGYSTTCSIGRGYTMGQKPRAKRPQRSCAYRESRHLIKRSGHVTKHRETSSISSEVKTERWEMMRGRIHNAEAQHAVLCTASQLLNPQCRLYTWSILPAENDLDIRLFSQTMTPTEMSLSC